MVQLEAQGAPVVSESGYCEFLRYKQSTEWVCNAIKRKHRSIGRVASGPRRTYSLLGLDIDCLVDTDAQINHIISTQAYNQLQSKLELPAPVGQGTTRTVNRRSDPYP